jgi:hypothetical protein
MNRVMQSILPFVAVASAVAQVPAVAPPPPSAAVSVTESSRVARFIAGPGDRPQALLLRNGTFVALSPGLSQRLPVSLRKGTSLQVTGDEFAYDGNRTVQAVSITVAGVSYADDPPPAAGAAMPPPPPPPPGGVGAAPPPPPPCGVPGPLAPRAVAPPPAPPVNPPQNPPGV